VSQRRAGSEFRTDDGVDVQYESEYSQCTHCGERYQTQAQARATSRARTAAVRAHAGLLTPDEIVAIRKHYGATQAELERILGVGKKTFARWEAGTVTPSRAADLLLRELRTSPSLFQRLADQTGVTVARPRREQVWEGLGNLLETSMTIAARASPQTPSNDVTTLQSAFSGASLNQSLVRLAPDL
jgi:putative zinc finger/helix-turn-helix YgiT family protein